MKLIELLFFSLSLLISFIIEVLLSPGKVVANSLVYTWHYPYIYIYMGLDVLQLLSKLPHFTYFASNGRHLMRYANLTLTQKWNFFLQITTFFWKSQLFNYRNYFLQTASFSHKSQLFSINRNYFLQLATIFYKAQLFSRNPNYFLQLCNIFLQLCNFFLRVTTIFYNLKTFFTIF